MSATKRINFTDGFSSEVVPAETIVSSNGAHLQYVDDAAYEAANGAGSNGSIYYNTTTNKTREYVAGAWRNQDSASSHTYDNSSSGLSATDSQAAIDEVEARVDINSSKVSADGSVETHSDVTSAGSGAIITSAERSAIGTNTTSISDHLADTTDAHDASAISNVAAGNIEATNVQAAIDELDASIGGKIGRVKVDFTNFTASVSGDPTWKTTALILIDGDTSFMSIASNQLTLDAGTYRITVGVGVKGAGSSGWVSLRFYDITSTTVYEDFTNVAYSGGSIISFNQVTINFTIASSNTFDFRTSASGIFLEEHMSHIQVEKRW